jgi:hypothetical protein
MRRAIIYAFVVLNLIASRPVHAQSKLAITDKAQFENTEIETILRDRLASDSIELTSMIDIRKRCDYWYATLEIENNELKMSVEDCNNKTAGTKNLGSRIMRATDSEKAILLYFALTEILKEPYKDTDITGPPPKIVPADSSAKSKKELPVINPAHHRSRYFFAPSSYNLEKGELYYNTLYFLVHDIQYGISNHFSLGMGTTFMGFPFYLTPKITIPINKKTAIAIGDLLMIGTWGTKFTGNLAYATLTTGGDYNNVTFGGGYLYLGNGDLTNVTNSLVINVSGLLKLSGHIYLITENYGSQFRAKKTAYNHVSYNSEEFNQNVFFIYGLTGIRIINKKNDITSWQFGLSYIFSSPGKMPAKYNSSDWYFEADSESRFIAFPVVGFTRKFGGRY